MCVLITWIAIKQSIVVKFASVKSLLLQDPSQNKNKYERNSHVVRPLLVHIILNGFFEAKAIKTI